MKDDFQIAVEAATQMAERSGVDMAIMSDLSIKPLKKADGEEVLEIVRCPAALKKKLRQHHRPVH
jgi:hypothetical protein|tara:strand:+ start:5331 stop:5525 length:195 start_codon:yes stop_codon:yes gene_type:complete